jgi:hypothetical protein
MSGSPELHRPRLGIRLLEPCRLSSPTDCLLFVRRVPDHPVHRANIRPVDGLLSSPARRPIRALPVRRQAPTGADRGPRSMQQDLVRLRKVLPHLHGRKLPVRRSTKPHPMRNRFARRRLALRHRRRSSVRNRRASKRDRSSTRTCRMCRHRDLRRLCNVPSRLALRRMRRRRVRSPLRIPSRIRPRPRIRHRTRTGTTTTTRDHWIATGLG